MSLAQNPVYIWEIHNVTHKTVDTMHVTHKLTLPTKFNQKMALITKVNPKLTLIQGASGIYISSYYKL